MLGAFVPIAFRDPDALDEGKARALQTAVLLEKVASPGSPPFLVLADDNGADPRRTAHAGRVTPALRLPAEAFQTFARGVDAVAKEIYDRTGLRTVFHHHGAGFIETPEEIEQLLALTDPDRVGLVFDTGHYMLGGGDVLDGLNRFRERIWYIHFKDFDPTVARKAAREGWGYFKQVAEGLFCELGQGAVPFGKVLDVLKARSYEGWICVEQDVLPGMGEPKESARRNRFFLNELGL
jgi:inosose dehydratase